MGWVKEQFKPFKKPVKESISRWKWHLHSSTWIQKHCYFWTKGSPTQLLMSRMLKSKLPMSTSLLKPRVVMKAQEELKEWSDRQKMYYDQNAKPLPQIMEDDTVRIRKGKTWEPAIVTEKHTAPRSFIATTPNGTAYWRNHHHLLPRGPAVITGPVYDHPVAHVAATPTVDITPPVAASNAEVPVAGSTNGRSDLQIPTKCTSSCPTVRLPARFWHDYNMNWTDLCVDNNQTFELYLLLTLFVLSITPLQLFRRDVCLNMNLSSSLDFLNIEDFSDSIHIQNT